jgi:scyllo-inositol 2-dehydrogenase (NADP+)
MISKIRVGIIGYGFSAKTFHLPFLKVLEPYDVRKIYTTQTPAHINHPSLQFTSRLEDIWEDQEIDLIIITSPNALHFEHAFKSLSHHKHVVVEKPFVLTEVEGRALIELAIQHQRVLTVFHNRRWDADFLTIQKLIKEGSLGEIYYFESRYDRFRPEVKNRWKEEDVPGSGILWDLVVHLIDQALLLFGLPSEVFADCAHQRSFAKTTDYFKVLLSYPSGLKVSLGGSNLCLDPGLKFVLHGTKGSFVKFGTDPQEACLMKMDFEPSPEWGKEREVNYGTLTFLDDQGLPQKSAIISEQGRYQEFYKRLAQTIRSQENLPVDPLSSLEVIKLLNVCHQSFLEKRVISYNDPEGHESDPQDIDMGKVL